MLWEENQAGKEIDSLEVREFAVLKGNGQEDCNTEYRLEESNKSHLAISVKGIATSRVAEPGCA